MDIEVPHKRSPPLAPSHNSLTRDAFCGRGLSVSEPGRTTVYSKPFAWASLMTFSASSCHLPERGEDTRNTQAHTVNTAATTQARQAQK